MFSEIRNACKSLYNRVKETVKTWPRAGNFRHPRSIPLHSGTKLFLFLTSI